MYFSPCKTTPISGETPRGGKFSLFMLTTRSVPRPAQRVLTGGVAREKKGAATRQRNRRRRTKMNFEFFFKKKTCRPQQLIPRQQVVGTKRGIVVLWEFGGGNRKRPRGSPTRRAKHAHQRIIRGRRVPPPGSGTSNETEPN
jgi:hypothetical protein